MNKPSGGLKLQQFSIRKNSEPSITSALKRESVQTPFRWPLGTNPPNATPLRLLPEIKIRKYNETNFLLFVSRIHGIPTQLIHKQS